MSLFIDLWNNTGGLKTNRKLRQHTRFGIHEGDGDSIANYLARVELSNILGKDNPLLPTILEHAKSNDLFARVSQHYELNKWVKSCPVQSKHWANLFEAWIACVVYERALYDNSDPLFDVRQFLSQIWSIRYRRLSRFFTYPLFTITSSIHMRSHNLNTTPISADTNPIIETQNILYPSDLFDEVLGVTYQHQKKPPPVRPMGFLATTTIMKHDSAEGTFKCCAFGANETEAREIARYRYHMRKSCCTTCDPSLNMVWRTNFVHGPKSALDTVRGEIFSTITSHIDETRIMGKDNVPKYLLEKMRGYFDSYLKSSVDKKIIAMINCQQVSVPLSSLPHTFHFLSHLCSFLPLSSQSNRSSHTSLWSWGIWNGQAISFIMSCNMLCKTYLVQNLC